MPLFLGVGLIHNFKNFFDSLGLKKPSITLFYFSLISTFPMLIGYYLTFDFNSEITITAIINGAIIAAFIEEIIFRGILFGQLFRFTKIGFLPTVIFSSLIFATGHLYQSNDLIILLGIFFTTLLGGILFSWVYVEWNFNLWSSIFLHLLMNLFWLLFSVSSNAFGNIYANIFRIVTIFLIIFLTILYKRKNKIPLKINKDTIWFKKTK
ncbi:CPBP family intramembrane glutamic endopeptidase [Tenacibaculum jejuense]|nr:CPBP family intramembrane glutamic endopeptidase [Tenacibaculum jejuense]